MMRLGTGGRQGPENLDRPLSNFDVIGIPTDAWSSPIWACYENMIPSCVLAFCCPCVLWSQIVVRAQIPLLISLKNSICQGKSGFGLFIDMFFWGAVLVGGLIAVLVLVNFPSITLFYLVLLAVLVCGGGFVYFLGHTRTAFKEK
jgi:hypothetical protein